MRVVVDFSKPTLIRKGGGNFGFHPVTQEPYMLGSHPEHIFHGNHEGSHPQGFDRPMFSHYGHLDEGTKGQWDTGEFGENIWKDEFGVNHMHGIDGLIRKIGILFKENGIDKNPKEVIQESINRYNNERKKKNDDGHTLPHVDSQEWRQLHTMDFSRHMNKNDSINLPIRGSHGSEEAGTDRHNQFGSVFLNSKAHKHVGRFPESYSIPMSHFLKEVLAELPNSSGLRPLTNLSDEGIYYPYMSVGALKINDMGNSVATRERNSKRTNVDSQGNILFHDSINSKLGIEQKGKAIGDIHSWEMMHHLPDVFYSTGKIGRGTDFSKFVNTLINLEPNRIPPEVLNEPFFAGVSRTFTLGEVISDATLAKKAILQLSKTPAALHMLMGDPKQGIAGQVVNALSEHINTPEIAETYNDFRTHVDAGKLKTAYQIGRKRKGHGVAADLFAFANLMGESEAGGGLSKLRDSVFNHHQPLHPDVEGQRRMTEQLARALAIHHGHTPNRSILSAEEMPSRSYGPQTISPLSSKELPQHIIDRHIHTTTPVQRPERGGSTLVEQPPVETEFATINPAARKKVAVQGRAPPPEAPTPDTSAAGGGPTMAEARQAFQYATPEQVQRVYAARQPPTQYMGGGQRTPDFSSPEAQERLARFQSSVSDLGQERLPLTFKAEESSVEDRLIKAMENLQIRDARLDDSVRKLLPQQKLSIYSEDDIAYMASKTQITKTDVKAILLSKGDWNRISKTFKIDESIIKAVKVAFMGGL